MFRLVMFRRLRADIIRLRCSSLIRSGGGVQPLLSWTSAGCMSLFDTRYIPLYVTRRLMNASSANVWLWDDDLVDDRPWS